jgi:hypothetical protein
MARMIIVAVTILITIEMGEGDWRGLRCGVVCDFVSSFLTVALDG